MNFTSAEFLCFFPIICIVYSYLPKKKLWMWLLGASFFFYLCQSPWTAVLLVSTIYITFVAAGKIYRSEDESVKKLWLWGTVIFCIGLLLIFKYARFHPVGISFYTFQTLSYVIDVYRGKIKPEEHPGYYALFVSFFPQLVAGPIERSERLLPQLKTLSAPKADDIRYGVGRMVQGFFKKLVVADALAVFVDRVYSDPSNMAGPSVVVGTVFFALQIYCDFSGYSDIACGAARIFGVRLTENFDLPYFATSIRDFWRRWHKTLTDWLTEYLYIPLGGSRKGIYKQCVNIMIVFLCSGLWHGGSLHYVLWGACHGCYLVAETLWERGRKGRENFWDRIPKTWKQLVTFLLVCFAWIFFRAEGVKEAFTMIRNLPFGWSIRGVKEMTTILQMKAGDVLQLALGLWCVKLLDERKDFIRGKYRIFGLYIIITAILLAWLLVLSNNAGNAFIYFQF